MNGWQSICRQLQERGVRCVFGIPGTQNAELFSEIALTDIKVVTTSSEKSAAFAAMGHAIGTGSPSILLTIAGPGFCYTAAPLVEATHDSVPIINIVIAEREKPGRKFQLQAIDHEGLAERLAKSTRLVNDSRKLMPALDWAWRESSRGEPGPVVVLLEREMLNDEIETESTPAEKDAGDQPSESDMKRVVEFVAGKKVLLLAGRGAAAAQESIREVVEKHGWTVMTTPSGRGILPEDHSSVLKIDGCTPAAVNAAIEEFDVVLVIGAKLAHNGSFGFSLRLPREKLIHVDASRETLCANYEASLFLQCDSQLFCSRLQADLDGFEKSPDMPDLDALRGSLDSSRSSALLEPEFDGDEYSNAEGFFSLLQQSLPAEAIFVLDSGYHQVIARKYLGAGIPNQIVFPSDFQSMGFALPAAIGLSLASPGKPIVVIHGDGGIRMCAMDLLTAAAEELAIAVCVIDDGKFGLIRMQQLASGNMENGVDLPSIDYGSLANACGTSYFEATDGLQTAIENFVESGKPTLIRQPISDGVERRKQHAKARRKGQLRRALGPGVTSWLRRKKTPRA